MVRQICRTCIHDRYVCRSKIGLFTGAGKGFVGDLHADLGITDLSSRGTDQPTLLTWQHRRLPALPLNTYKHQRGKVVIVGGDHGMGGAVLMAAEAALRCGAGLVSVVSRPEHRSALLARVPEAMFVDAESAALPDALNAADFIVIGPGLGRDSWGAGLFAMVAATAAAKLIDADGLYWLARADEMPAGDLFITPQRRGSKIIECRCTRCRSRSTTVCTTIGAELWMQCGVKGSRVSGSDGKRYTDLWPRWPGDGHGWHGRCVNGHLCWFDGAALCG